MLPNEDKPIAEAEETVVRRAIWSLPKPILWVAVVAGIVVTVFLGGK